MSFRSLKQDAQLAIGQMKSGFESGTLLVAVAIIGGAVVIALAIILAQTAAR